MATARQDYIAWLAQYEASKLPYREHGADAPGSIFTEPVARSFSATSSLRRGFNGKKPRTSAPELTGPCTVTTRTGDVYTITRRGKRKDNLVRTVISHSLLKAANHTPANGGNPDA